MTNDIPIILTTRQELEIDTQLVNVDSSSVRMNDDQEQQ